MTDDVVSTEELQRAIELLSPAARHELTAMVYRVRWEDARDEVRVLQRSIANYEQMVKRPEGRSSIADAAARAARAAHPSNGDVVVES